VTAQQPQGAPNTTGPVSTDTVDGPDPYRATQGWTDDFDSEANYRRSLAWHRAGCPGGEEYVAWLIARGDLVTSAEAKRIHDRAVSGMEMERKVQADKLAAIYSSVDESVRKTARVNDAVTKLVDRRKKTLRMSDLLEALEIRE
jgi:hypothetical protein